MKPQLDKIRAEAEANWENQIRLSEIIEKLLRVIEVLNDAKEFSDRVSHKAQVEVLRILEGTDV